MIQVDQIRERLRSLGAKPEHERRLMTAWVRALELTGGRHKPAHYLPATIREAVPQLREELASIARVKSEHPGADGSSRLLVELHDGQLVESVILTGEGVCVSSQVGCAVGCVFCMTGRSGLIRQLGSAEIVAQVALARARKKIQRVVLMGMGEPSHNLGNVLDAIETLGTEGGIAHTQLVFSTVGDRRAFERLPRAKVRPALALSLHTTRADVRARLLPRAPRIDPAELVELAAAYAETIKYPVQYQWALIEGVNDSEEEMDGLVKLLHRRRAILNLIPYNTVAGLEFRRPEWDRIREMARTLHRRGVLTKVRRSAGQDVDGGCGQLRARSVPSSAPSY